MNEKLQLDETTEIYVDEQGFVFFEIDDGEDDIFICGDIGLGYLIDALNEVVESGEESVSDVAVENYPSIFVSKFDEEVEIVNADDTNPWRVSAELNLITNALKSFIVSD